ncbi:hypothetical protein GCM10016455_27290 [Aliiroseovarius zhejiangensis]|uniref:Copper resistance protein B n=1 Tax=Aliiroseovarius zhejiangensis TaxID=1632025 RepID=A0ABQ3JAT3_9RHOB|nr:hypothetical protein [Aliiroseovarius zhejiangensis]GHF04569.1 hypothetical protein GCM10016455_27290 [Aliiroseovarius zhejiangensis]
MHHWFVLLALALLVVSGDPVHAGAWPREKGEGFVSGQVRQDVDTPEDAPTVSIYGEYGLSDRWTIGGKLDYALAVRDIARMKAFARWHVPDDGGPWRKAIGFAVEGTEDDPQAVPSLHLGRGFDTAIGPGWLDMELAANVSILEERVDYSAFAQIGVKPTPRLMTMVALDVTRMDAGAQVDLTPSVVWEYRSGKHLQLEWSSALEGAVKHEIAAGIWLEF